MPVGRAQPLDGEPRARAEHDRARALARARRPPSITPTRQAILPGALSRSMPTSAACASPYGKNASGRSPTLPSTSRAPRAPARRPSRRRPARETTASTGPRARPPGPTTQARRHACARARAKSASARRRAGAMDSPGAAGGGTARSRRPAPRTAAARRARRRRRAASSSSSGFFFSSLATYSAILAFWATMPFRFCSNWRAASFRSVRSASVLSRLEDTADERERGLRVLDAGDVVRHVGPEARRRDAFVAAGRVEHADDARRPFVPGRADAEPRGQLGIIGAAREAHGPRVGHLAEQGPERQDERSAHAPGQLEHARAVRAPLEMRLDGHADDQVALELRGLGERELGGGPDDLALGPRVRLEPDIRAARARSDRTPRDRCSRSGARPRAGRGSARPSSPTRPRRSSRRRP